MNLRPVFLLIFVFGASVSSANAQGLLWKLPADEGEWVRYEGEYKHEQERPYSQLGKLSIPPWRAELTLKSISKTMAEFEGENVPCRWIEIKWIVGYQTAQGIDPGPFGTRIYKVLVPESQVVDRQVDEKNLPITYIPIIRGVRKMGGGEPQEIKEKVLHIYPTLGLFANYRDLKTGGNEVLELPGELGEIRSSKRTGVDTVESSVSRSVNKGEIWLAPDLPFGWAKYHAKVVREEKETTAPRADFKVISDIEVELTAVEKGTNAQSELPEVSE